MQLLKRYIWTMISLIRLLFGLFVYVLKKETPPSAHLSMIFLFCRTRGYSNRILSRLISVFSRPYKRLVEHLRSDFTSAEEVSRAAGALNARGYYIFENRLPEDLCERLLQFAVEHPATKRSMDGDVPRKAEESIYNRSDPGAVRYDFNTQDLLNNPDIQHILADLSFSAVAQEYLQAKPIMDIVAMWWHTSFSNKPDSEAAQYFHFDMDRPKWLKFFIYLTDVESANGPHVYVAGSHKDGGIPAAILKKGYARLSDGDVESLYPAENVIEFTAPRGTIIAEDTRGLHKGKHVEVGDRLILQLEFCNSLFGARYPKFRFKTSLNEELSENIRNFPKIYSAYL